MEHRKNIKKLHSHVQKNYRQYFQPSQSLSMYNKTFNLTPNDIKLIENALRAYEHDPQKKQELLAKIHNQKVWYRPKDQIYVSG